MKFKKNTYDFILKNLDNIMKNYSLCKYRFKNVGLMFIHKENISIH